MMPDQCQIYVHNIACASIDILTILLHLSTALKKLPTPDAQVVF